MTERSYFFNSTDNDKRVYQAEDFAKFFEQVLGGYESVGRTGTGVSRFADNSLEAIKATQTGTDMSVEVTPGYAFITGKMYRNDATLSLTCDTAHPNYDRIDRVVIRLDENTNVRNMRAVIKKGTPASSPKAPALEWSTYIKEISIAQVRVVAARTYITNDDITDERANINVCGYLPLHNIYRGQEIDERGVVTLPNQSYIEMSDVRDLTIAGDSSNNYITTEIPIVPLIDRQNEVKNGFFYPNTNGTYLFTFQIMMYNQMNTTEKMEADLIINDKDTFEERVYIFSRPGIGTGDLSSFGSCIKYLQAGDKVKVQVASRNFGGSRKSQYRRLSIAKIN